MVPPLRSPTQVILDPNQLTSPDQLVSERRYRALWLKNNGELTTSGTLEVKVRRLETLRGHYMTVVWDNHKEELRPYPLTSFGLSPHQDGTYEARSALVPI